MKRCTYTLLLIVQTLALYAKELSVEEYHAHSSIQWSWAISSLYDITLYGNESILDLKSADGKLAAHLAERFPKEAL